jgi:hypothetical protein
MQGRKPLLKRFFEERKMKNTGKIIAAITSLVFIALFSYLAVSGKIYPLGDLPLRFMNAFLGAIITAGITLLLLNSQSAAEELKERNVKVFKKKSRLYENYIENLYQIIEKRSIKINDFEDIESEFYSKIVLYLKKEFREEITCCFGNITDCVETSVIEESLNDHFETDNAKTKNFDRLRRNLSKIINLLVEDLGLAGRIDMDLQMETEKKYFQKKFRATLLQEVIDCFPKEKELFIKRGFYAKEEDDDPYIILDLQGENSLAGEIYIGPFVNRDKERLKFKVRAPQFNPVADLYTLENGNDKEKCFISLENKEAQDEYDEKGYIDLSLPLDDDTFKDSELDRDMYNKFIPSFSFEDSDSFYSRYHGIYLDVCKAIAKRAYYYFRKTPAVRQKDSPLLKELCLKIGKVTESETNKYIVKKQGI